MEGTQTINSISQTAIDRVSHRLLRMRRMPGYILCLLLSILCVQSSAGAVFHAGIGKASIRKAIENASPGDTVVVAAGHYREGNIIVDKAITLRGIGYPVLDGEQKWEVVTIKADNVTFEGFKVVNCGRASLNDVAGIKILGVRGVTIRNNILDNNGFAIYTQFGTSCTIEGNRIRAYGTKELLSGNGIHCWKCDDMRIINNDIDGHRDGIYFEFVTNSIIWRNRSHRNIRYGLHFMFSHNDAYISNVFSANGAGVAVMYTRGIRMFNNYFEESWGDAAYGLLLKDISDSYIEGNHFRHNTTGIHMEGSSRIQMVRNTFESNGFALRIQGSCENDSLIKNSFVGNTFDVSSNSSHSLNFFSHNYWDKYEGYDLKRDGIGDVPYHPVSLFSTVVETNPPAMMLFRSFMVTLLDKTEKVLPSITPEGLKDDQPSMRRSFTMK